MSGSEVDSVELSVIMPVKDGADVLPRSLGALAESDLPRSAWELIVVDDGSTDATPRVAAEHADHVLQVEGGPLGPAAARNLGVGRARGRIVVFIDADVLVHADTLRRFRDLFDARPDVAAAFGAYDVEPGDPGFLSQYRNLYHRYVHVRGAGEAGTFWAGCGAVRRRVFVDVGMFDADRFPRPQIEDIELGYRLRAHGERIVLDPAIQATHLKKWGFEGMVRTDLLDRGVPWVRLVLEYGGEDDSENLNLRTDEKIKTLLVGLSLAFLLLAGLTTSLVPLAGAAASLLLVVAWNLPLYRWFARVKGPWFAVRVVPFNLLYYFLSGVAVVLGWTTHLRDRLRPEVSGLHPGSAGADRSRRPEEGG